MELGTLRDAVLTALRRLAPAPLERRDVTPMPKAGRG
jgi:hypothetical protein